MPGVAFPIKSYVVTLNVKSTGATEIIPTQARKFVVTGCKMIGIATSGAGDGPTVKFGQASTHDNIVAATQVGAAANTQNDMFLETAAEPSAVPVLDLTSNAVYVNVTVASAKTTHTAWAVVEGYWLP
jgi:hypothetical protein